MVSLRISYSQKCLKPVNKTYYGNSKIIKNVHTNSQIDREGPAWPSVFIAKTRSFYKTALHGTIIEYLKKVWENIHWFKVSASYTIYDLVAWRLDSINNNNQIKAYYGIIVTLTRWLYQDYKFGIDLQWKLRHNFDWHNK